MSLISRYVMSNKGRVLSIVHSHGMTIGRLMSSGVDRVNEDEITKSVFISQSKDIFTNLALEDWLYRNNNFKNHHILLLWKNDPCVVIGRHQNPWIEANIQGLEEQEIAMARRNSGGGTVYHDAGNLNLSFFTPKERYNRRYNLEIITRALYREWGVRSDINKREDIVVNGNLKVSGTAAKLGRPSAYHHCTLLVNVNKDNLSMALEKKETGITTNATVSTRSPVKNLSEINARVNTDALMSAVGWEYLRTKAMSLEDGGHPLVQKQKGFQMINPTEQWFPGLYQLRDEFKSWQWNYGKSPKFTVTRDLKIPTDSKNSSDSSASFHQLKLTLEVKNGIVEDIKLSLPPNVLSNAANKDASVITHLRGARYDHDITERIISALGCTSVALDATQRANISNMAATQ